MIALHVGGVGLWTPGFASAAAWASGTPDPAVTSPRSEILPAALRRRASPLTSMVASAAGEAAAQAGADLARLPFVLGSALGEIGIAVTMLNEYRVGEGLPSPTRFHNAVHNGPAAYVSIATANRGFSTALAAGPETPAAALLEAAALLAERGGDVMVVLADEPPRSPSPRLVPTRRWRWRCISLPRPPGRGAPRCASCAARRPARRAFRRPMRTTPAPAPWRWRWRCAAAPRDRWRSGRRACEAGSWT